MVLGSMNVYRAYVPDPTDLLVDQLTQLLEWVKTGVLDSSALEGLRSITEGESAIRPSFPTIGISPSEQLALTRQRNEELGLGFTKEDFDKLGDAPPWPESRLSAVVLDVSLDTVEQTFEVAWHYAASIQPGSWHLDRIKSDPEHLRLLKGIEHKRGLRWRVINFGANWERAMGIRPQEVRDPNTSPTAAVLWAASYFPKWVHAMDGKTVPYAWIPGYEVTVTPCLQWSHMLRVGWSKDHVTIGINATFANDGYRDWAVPCFID